MAGQHHVHDARDRRAWVGPSDQMVLGYSRAWIAAAAGATMLAAVGTEYGCGALAVRLGTAHHWGPLTAGWAFAAWLACQLTALPVGRRRPSIPPPAKTALYGAVCCVLGLLLAGRIADPAGALAVDVVTAGAGSGLLYGTCVAVVAGWFPDKHIPAGLVSLAFACGLVPVALVAATVRDAPAPPSALAWVTVTVTALCAPLLRDAPRHWWPSRVKSLNHTMEIRRNR
jgi:hypothetical protein